MRREPTKRVGVLTEPGKEAFLAGFLAQKWCAGVCVRIGGFGWHLRVWKRSVRHLTLEFGGFGWFDGYW